MPAMTTTLKPYGNAGDAVLFRAPSHTYADEFLVKQKRERAVSPTANVSMYTEIKRTARDSEGTILQGKHTFGCSYRGPANAVTAERDEAIALFREYVASDEFVAAVVSGDYVVET